LFEARREKWGYGVDGEYVKLTDEDSNSVTGPGGNVTIDGAVEVSTSQQLYTGWLGYRVVEGKVKVDVIGAARYTRLDTDLDVAITLTPPILPGGQTRVSDMRDWWDPLVGARVVVPLGKKWTFVGYGDFGGFGVGSDTTYQAIAAFDWQFSKIASLKFGYRDFYQDFEEDDFVYDMTVAGALVGFGLRF
jgi:hypothetical protein